MIDVILPNLTWTMNEARIAKWLKAPGDHVAEGEALFEAELDKATMEVESPGTGTLAEIVVAEDTVVPFLTVVARIEPEGD